MKQYISRIYIGYITLLLWLTFIYFSNFFFPSRDTFIFLYNSFASVSEVTLYRDVIDTKGPLFYWLLIPFTFFINVLKEYTFNSVYLVIYTLILIQLFLAYHIWKIFKHKKEVIFSSLIVMLSLLLSTIFEWWFDLSVESFVNIATFILMLSFYYLIRDGDSLYILVLFSIVGWSLFFIRIPNFFIYIIAVFIYLYIDYKRRENKINYSLINRIFWINIATVLLYLLMVFIFLDMKSFIDVYFIYNLFYAWGSVGRVPFSHSQYYLLWLMQLTPLLVIFVIKYREVLKNTLQVYYNQYLLSLLWIFVLVSLPMFLGHYFQLLAPYIFIASLYILWASNRVTQLGIVIIVSLVPLLGNAYYHNIHVGNNYVEKWSGFHYNDFKTQSDFIETSNLLGKESFYVHGLSHEMYFWKSQMAPSPKVWWVIIDKNWLGNTDEKDIIKNFLVSSPPMYIVTFNQYYFDTDFINELLESKYEKIHVISDYINIYKLNF